MYEWFQENYKFVQDLTSLVRGTFQVKFKRKIIENLLITDVHNRDIVWKLYEQNV